MATDAKVVIVAALEREIRPLVHRWRARVREHAGYSFKFYESERAVAVCGGIGPQAARRAAEAAIHLYAPGTLISAGFAGALQPEVQVGDVLTARTVVNAADGTRRDSGAGNGVLVSLDAVADPAQKAKLAAAYGAQAVDMEAAAVALVAEIHGIKFMACKAISDACDFRMPPVAEFVDAGGNFHGARFGFHILARPWLWGRTLRLAKNSARAARNLCRALAGLHEIRTESPIPMLPTSAGVKS
jgi:adenosylhomocysteine nucleosidase